MENKIGEKIIEIEKLLMELESVLPISFEEYINDWKIRDICERRSEKIIEGLVDLAFLTITKHKLPSPNEDKQAFDILVENKIISEELCNRLKDAKGMRNIIAHEYGKIDDEIVFEAVTEQLTGDTKEFIENIKNRLK